MRFGGFIFNDVFSFCAVNEIDQTVQKGKIRYSKTQKFASIYEKNAIWRKKFNLTKFPWK